LAIFAYEDYEIVQFDITLTFLYRNLDEEIYMLQPNGFTNKNDLTLICRLLRSLYGLHQAEFGIDALTNFSKAAI